MPEPIQLQALPPKEAIDLFRKKGYKIGFNWRDVAKQEHAYAFTVAKAMRQDILQDIRAGVDSAIAEGITFKEFSNRIKPTLQEKGWWGKKLMIDPKTGEEKLVQLGSARRLNTIFDTNLRSAYSAGAWERIQRVKKTRPYLRYIAVLDNRTRDKHRQWHDVILPVDDPFWQKFYPPNGWHCRCTVQQLSMRDLKRLGLEPTSTNPATPDVHIRDKRNGKILKVPRGIDPGFDFNPGMARMKSLTPPQLNKPLNVPFNGRITDIPLPVARTLKKAVLYPDGLEDTEYVDKFLKEFKASSAKPVIFKDVAGEDVIISDDLFKTATGRLKINKNMRYKYLGMLAKTIKDPDEIWLRWEEYPKGRWTLRRKYIARYDIDGKKARAFVLFDTNEKGWSGVTTFQADRESYFEKQRGGSLIWRREDKK